MTGRWNGGSFGFDRECYGDGGLDYEDGWMDG